MPQVIISVLNCILYLKIESLSLQCFQDVWIKLLHSSTSTQYYQIYRRSIATLNYYA